MLSVLGKAYKSCMCKVNDLYEILGGYCGGVSPLPIPNREVKPTCADGTAMQCGRVGGRLLFIYDKALEFRNDFQGFFRICP